MNFENLKPEPKLVEKPDLLQREDVREMNSNHYADFPMSTLFVRFDYLKDRKDSESLSKIMGLSDTLTRAALKYKNDNPSQESFELYLKVINSCREIYHNARLGKKMTKEGKDFISELQKSAKFNDIRVDYHIDIQTTYGLAPFMLPGTLDEILEIAEGKTLLLIPIANGGIISAFEVSTHIQNDINKDSLILPIKFSRRKHKDAFPIITPEDIELIKYYIEEKNAIPVIWDDDIHTAITVVDFFRYISKVTDHDEFRILGGYIHRQNDIPKDQATLNLEMRANSTLDDLEPDQLPK